MKARKKWLMKSDVKENLIVYVKHTTPLLVSLFLLIMSYFSMGATVSNDIKPCLGLICIYFWMIYRQDIFGLVSVFILGFVNDIISTAPFGTNLFEVLLLYVLINNFYKFINGKSFLVVWCGFAVLALAVMLSKWLLISVYYAQFLPLHVLMFSFFMTVAFYPLISLVNSFVSEKIIGDEE